MSRFVVGIDLGTTHSALATVDTEQAGARPEVMSTVQLIQPHEHGARPLLPSFLYFAHEGEGALALPWDASRSYAVGELARRRSAEAPGRVISSAKSWLSHTGVDRRSEVLPVGAPDDVEKISPVEASYRYLDHLAESWQNSDVSRPPLAEQEVVLAVPASFDAAARDLTVEAAYAAGFEQVSLLEEPQAAMYAWLEAKGDSWRQELSVGDVILVVDIGGGTTDFSAIACDEEDGALTLRRVAVGEHILLGGDNMDLALAHTLAARLANPDDPGAEPRQLDRWQLGALVHACRAAKERLLSEPDLAAAPVVVPTRGSQLLGGSLRLSLERADVSRVLLAGFFPEVSVDARPKARARAGLTQVGLPYASDPAVTRHLAAFLTRQAGALGGSEGLLRPTRVLFNGGVLKAPHIKSRILTTMNGWLTAAGAAPAVELSGGDLDLAVARGASYFGAVRRTGALKIRGGTARAYYVGIEAPTPAVPGMEPPISALCVAPFGMEEGTRAELPPHELALIVGEPVRFRFFGSSVRRQDAPGTELMSWSQDELTELSPIEVTLPAEGRAEGDLVAIQLHASVTAIGTLLLEAEPLTPLTASERWKLELSVRE